MELIKLWFALLLLVIYSITFFCVVKLKKSAQLKCQNFTHLRLKKNCISFVSNGIHRIKISNAKIMQMNNILYLNLSNRLVIISNVKDVKIYESYLYFTALGKVEILIDLKTIYKYFAIQIRSKQFDINELKQRAIIDLMNNNFDINFCKIMKRYIKIIEKVLNIVILQKKIIVKPNKFKLSFVLSYKLNNQIKRVSIQ